MKYLKKFNENLSTSFLQKVKFLGVQKTKEEIENDI